MQGEGEAMLIQVNYADGRNDYVKGFVLDRLIETKEIVKFKRSSGWVTIGVDPVRTARRELRTKFGW